MDKSTISMGHLQFSIAFCWFSAIPQSFQTAADSPVLPVHERPNRTLGRSNSPPQQGRETPVGTKEFGEFCWVEMGNIRLTYIYVFPSISTLLTTRYYKYLYYLIFPKQLIDNIYVTYCQRSFETNCPVEISRVAIRITFPTAISWWGLSPIPTHTYLSYVQCSPVPQSNHQIIVSWSTSSS